MSEKILADRYRLVEQIGMGGMAIVYKAVDLRTGHNVAVKVLRPEFNEDSESKRPTVQVGDPFVEKLLLEACQHLWLDTRPLIPRAKARGRRDGHQRLNTLRMR